MLSGSSSDRLCFFFYRTEDKACHNNISHGSSRRAAVHTHTHIHAHTFDAHMFPQNSVFTSLSTLKYERFVQSKNNIGFFFLFCFTSVRAKGEDGERQTITHTSWQSSPWSDIGSGEKHTIRNQYSAPNCCWQAWAGQNGKNGNIITHFLSLSRTPLLIHMPVINKCTHLKRMWQTMPTAGIRGIGCCEKRVCIYRRPGTVAELNPSATWKGFSLLYFPPVRVNTFMPP